MFFQRIDRCHLKKFERSCVPFLVYWKGKIQPQVSDALVCQLDFMASIAALTGQKLEKGFDSQNTLPAFLGKSKKARTELVIEAQGRTGTTTQYTTVFRVLVFSVEVKVRCGWTKIWPTTLQDWLKTS